MIPTPEDMVKYAGLKSRLLVEFPHMQTPIEITVKGVVNDGELFSYSLYSYNSTYCYEHYWQHTHAVQVHAILPSPAPPAPTPTKKANDKPSPVSRVRYSGPK